MLTKSQRGTLPAEPLQFGDKLRQVQKVLIFFPLGIKHARIARYALQKLRNHRPDLEVQLVVNPEVMEFVEWPATAIMEIPKRGSRFKWESLRGPLEWFAPDLILQLEPQPPVGLLKLVRKVPAPLKTGLGDDLEIYNIAHLRNGLGFYENFILNLIGLLNRRL